MRNFEKGFVIIFSITVTAVILLMALAIVNLGCGEILQVRKRNDTESAYYAAVAGAERMYARLKGYSNGQLTVTWPETITGTNITVGGVTLGRYTVTANLTGAAGEFMIVSDGVVNNRTVRVTAKYGFVSTYVNGIPFASVGPIDFQGDRWWFLRSWVYVEGPIESRSAISPSSNTNSVYVQYSGDVIQNESGLADPSFWLSTPFDTQGDGSNWIDGDSSESITQDEVPPGMEGAFAADDVNSDSVIDKKDAFIYYYTVNLNNQYNLGINEGGPNYYSGDRTIGPWNIPAGTNMIFVDGDVNIVFNAQQWWGNTSDLTIVSTGDITIVQPVNGADDRLTLVALGDTMTGGVNLGEIADIDGNLISYSGNNFTAILGGNTNGSIFASGQATAHTGLPSFLFNRDFNKGTDDWSNPANRPLGLPPNFGVVSRAFSIRAENLGSSGYKPRWQRR